MENIFDFKKNKINKTRFGSYSLNGIPNGCKYCINGEKLVLFITGVCKTGCIYCPLSNLRKGKDTIWANEKQCNSVSDVIEEAKESNAKGAGITGGDPLVELERTIEYARALKKEFGKCITFWGGGCNTRDVLPDKTPTEVKEDVKRRIEIFSKGGGFVFNQIHNILANIKPENVIAMLEAAYEYGKY